MLDSTLSAGPDEKGWWAVYIKHQHEKSVAEMLATKGAEVFLPLYETERRRPQRTVKLILPLFPGYVFVRNHPKMRLPVLSTPGVHHIVAFGVVPDCEIRNLQIAMAAKRGIEPHALCQIGERVRIVRGALQGLEGFLVRQKNRYRILLSVQMLAQAAAVEVHVSEVLYIHSEQDNRISAHTYSHEGIYDLIR